MASNTPRLGLYKKDPVADRNDTFNIQTMLNDNWDRIDQGVVLETEKGVPNGVATLGPDGKVPTAQLPSASTSAAGIVQLNDTVSSTSTTQAATANAVKQVNDALAAHSADTTNPHPIYAKKQQEAWIAPTLLNGWGHVGFGTSTAGYMKDNFNFVHLKGSLWAGITSDNTILFTLPVGYRPLEDLTFPVFNASSSYANITIGTVRVKANGDVIIIKVPYNGLLFLDGITFRAEQ
ncbi:phage tail protein [Anoxybacillus geothermalis]|nr:phage tail protein [Anoxybacillus geothermalis]